jgi:hypothetical protein
MATTYLNLELPTVSVTLGPTWASEVNTAFETIDDHDHTSGKGRQIPTAGININANLSFNSLYKATSLMSAQFTSQSSALSGASEANSTYSLNGDLYFVNGSGVGVQVTDGGALASVPASANIFEYTDVTSNVVIGPADTFVTMGIDTSSSRTITLPLASGVSAGRFYILLDRTGNARANNITVARSGSDLINGLTSLTIDSDRSSTMITGDGSGNWYII